MPTGGRGAGGCQRIEGWERCGGHLKIFEIISTQSGILRMGMKIVLKSSLSTQFDPYGLFGGGREAG